MNEYISREAILEKAKSSILVPVDNEWDCGYNTAMAEMRESIKQIPSADVQPVDTKEILRHLDSLMICIGNAYDTSHGLLRSDMEFIEKQEKIIKELLNYRRGEKNG